MALKEQFNFPFYKEKKKSMDEDAEAIQISVESQVGKGEVKKVILPKSKEEIKKARKERKAIKNL